MLAIWLLFVVILEVSTNALGQFQPVSASAPDHFERSAAMARAQGRNIHSTRTPIAEFENTCIFSCMPFSPDMNHVIIRDFIDFGILCS